MNKSRKKPNKKTEKESTSLLNEERNHFSNPSLREISLKYILKKFANQNIF